MLPRDTAVGTKVYRLNRRILWYRSGFYFPLTLLGIHLALTQAWELWLMAIIAAAMYGTLVYEFVAFRVVISPDGISSGLLRLQSLSWKEVEEVNRTGTGFAGRALWQNGLDIFGKDSQGRRVHLTVPNTFHRVDYEEIEHAIRRYTGLL